MAPAVWGQEEKAPKKRPRIRVYDQSPQTAAPVLLPGEPAQTPVDLQKKMGTRAMSSRGMDSPLSGVTLLPMQPVISQGASFDEKEEEDNGLSPSEFLIEDDLILTEEDLNADPEEEEVGEEMEITDWEELQKAMIKEALKKEEPEMSEEDMEEMFSSEDENSENRPGEISDERQDPAPLMQLEMAGKELQNRSDADAPDELRFVPVLSSNKAYSAADNRNESGRDTRKIELSGSKKIMTDLKEKWEKTSESKPSRKPLPRIEVVSLPSRSPSPARSAPGGFPGLSMQNPAVRPLPQPGIRPAPRPAPAQIKPKPLPQPRAADLLKKDNRIRSRIGITDSF